MNEEALFDTVCRCLADLHHCGAASVSFQAIREEIHHTHDLPGGEIPDHVIAEAAQRLGFSVDYAGAYFVENGKPDLKPYAVWLKQK